MAYLIALTDEELDSPACKLLRGPQFKMYMVLRRFADWDTGVASGAFSYFGRAAGVHKGNTLRQLRKLAAAKLIKFVRCHAGRQTAALWTQIQVFDFTGEPLCARRIFAGGELKLRKRNASGADAQLQRCESATNTNNKERSLTTNMKNEEGNAPTAAEPPVTIGGGAKEQRQEGVDEAATMAVLASHGVRGPNLKRLAGFISSRIATEAWKETERQCRYRNFSAERLTGYYIRTCQYMHSDSIHNLQQTNKPALKENAKAQPLKWGDAPGGPEIFDPTSKAELAAQLRAAIQERKRAVNSLKE